jgi:RHS repeat-associated protein
MPDEHEGMVDNKYLYNDKELFDDGDLNWLDYGFRNYDAQIGRFVEIDPLTDDYPMLSGYHYALNDPIGNIDEYGLSGVPITAAQKAAGYTLEGVVVTSSKSFLQKVGSFINKNITTAGKMLEDGIQHLGAAALGAANAWSSDQLLGQGLYDAKEQGWTDSKGVAFQIGQKIGHAVSMLSGAAEIGDAAIGEIASFGLATPVAIPLAVHGSTAFGLGLYRLLNGSIVYSTSSGNSSGSSSGSSNTPSNAPIKYKKPKPNISGKEGAKDVPSWAKGERPMEGENGDKFSRRLLDKKYGKGNYPTKSQTEYSKIKKWGDRAFE